METRQQTKSDTDVKTDPPVQTSNLENNNINNKNDSNIVDNNKIIGNIKSGGNKAPVEGKKSKDEAKPPSPLTVQNSIADTKMLYKKAYRGVKKTRSRLKESPLALFSLLRKKGSTRQEILEQTNSLAEDYIYSRLLHLLPASEERDAIEDKNLAELNEVSFEIQAIGHRLETSYPHLYENISAQVNMPNFKTETAIRRVISCVSDTMFKNGQVTWCRMIAMFAISAAVAVECVKHSKVENASHCVSALTESLDKYAVDWVMEQGGWVDLTREYRVITNEARTLWTVWGIGASVGFALLWVLTQTI